jgi:putative phage-type endonuclease
MEQRSDEWFAARLGKVTASRVSDIMAKTKSGYSTSRKNYMAELLCERMTGRKEEGFESPAMKWGTETEPLARMAFELETGLLVEEVGLVDHATIPMFAASPDGLIGSDQGLEIKCPNTATHLETLLNGTIKSEYIIQMQVAMACTGRKNWYFASFDPRLPAHLQLFIKSIPRDDDQIAEIESEVKSFLAELDELIARLEARGR